MKKRFLKKFMILTLSAATVLSSVPATTVTAAGNPYPTTQDVDQDGLYEIPCTRFAWQCVYERQGIALPAWGNAVNWWQNAINQGYAVGNDPLPGSIAVWSGDYYGHVAYVTGGSGDTFTVDEGGRTDLDQTSSHGIAYGYTLTNSVGGRRPYDSNKILLGFIYPGCRMPGKPYANVNAGKSGQTTTFTWNATSNTQYYDVYIYKDGESNIYKCQSKVTGTSWACTLPAGNYRMTVASVNHAKYAYTFSDYVNFTVQAAPVAHTHNYKKVTKKATTKANGYTQEKCSCGKTRNKKTIYYPKKIQLSKTNYVYDGKTKKPTVKVIGSNNKVISAGNYKVTYSAGRKYVGTYKVTIQFKGNYSGTVTKTFKITGKSHKHNYTNKLPANVTSSKYTIQYKHTYKKTTSQYVNDGSVYETVRTLDTSAARQLVGYYYYHFCGPSTGNNVNFAQTGAYVHFDSVAANQVTVAASGADGDDPSIAYYLLNWNGNGNRVWCSSGTTCDGSNGSHGSRGQAWYRMNQYQNKKLQTQTTTSESGWTSKKDSKAIKTVYRYKAK